MKFQAFACECGFDLATAEDEPICPECGKSMILMKEDSARYKKFNNELKQLFK